MCGKSPDPSGDPVWLGLGGKWEKRPGQDKASPVRFLDLWTGHSHSGLTCSGKTGVTLTVWGVSEVQYVAL